MSGFEVTGVVLAVLPLVISALEHYKSGAGAASSFVKWRGHLDTLLYRLKTQRTLFYLNAMILLRAAGVDDLTGQDEGECVRVLMEEQTGKMVEEYLDFTYSTFESTIREYERCLKLIVQKLVNIKRVPHAEKDDLRAVIEANPPTEGRFLFRQRLEFTLERKALKSLVSDLGEDNLTLETVIRGMKTVRELQSQSPAGESKRLAKSLQTVQTGALSLHSAITSGWATGCHAAHRVMLNLKLNPGVQDHKVNPRSVRKDPIVFQIFISADQDQADVRTEAEKWHSVSVMLQQDAWDEEPSLQTQAPPNILAARSPNSTRGPAPHMSSIPEVKIKSASFSTMQNPSKSVSQPITDMCLAVQQCSLKKQNLSLRLSTGRLHMPNFRSPPNPGWAQKQVFAIERHRVTDLGKFLRKTSQIEEHQMGFLERTELAFSIAISLLSFHSTHWLEKPWTKESIHFFLKGQSDTRIDTVRPVIMQIVPKAAGTAGALAVPILSEPKSALLELGILLLELWHHRTLEDWAAQTNRTYKDTPEDRRIAATRWLEMTSNRLTTKYTSAVEGCLAFCAGRIRSWQEDDFRRQICEDIIKPLKDNCKAWSNE